MSTPLPTDESRTSKKPSNTAFKQQRLKAWQPILTAGTVLPAFFVIGITFIPIGVGLFISSNQVTEIPIDYTDCTNKDNTSEMCKEIIPNRECKCSILIPVLEPLQGSVYLYYGLTNFYQNHRRYVKSRDDYQLLGDLDPNRKLSKDCEPYDANEYNDTKRKIAPCGAIANSLFNDTFEMQDDEHKVIILQKTGIAWKSDKKSKFHNPKDMNDFKNFDKPRNWRKDATQLDPDDKENNGFQNEDFIVWMRTAALPTFRKLHRIILNDGKPNSATLRKGNYTLIITYNYPVNSFGGTKRIILSTTSWLGGKNSFLGLAYIVVGCFCVLLGVVFLFIHTKFGKSPTDTANLTSRS